MANRFMDHHQHQWEELQSLSPTHRLTWEDYLKSIELDTNRVQNIISELSECTCCEPHQQDRPDYLCKLVDDTTIPYLTSDTNNPNKCECPCRHNIRELCRIFSP
jgi:hypothetical protein